jgi:hypothetical protein
VAERDAYAALLVSLHWESVLGRLGDVWLPGTEAVLDGQRSYRAYLVDLLREEGVYVSEAALARNQEQLRAVDDLALFLTGRYPLDSRARGDGAPPLGLELEVRDGSRAVLRPYPFAADPLEVTFPGRRVPDRAYASQAEFLDEFYRARPVTISYSLSSG